MARRVISRPAAQVRALIGRALLESAPVSAALGQIVLHEHQLSAVALLRDRIRRHGGALLADSTGLGKTFVALSLAREYQDPLVIAPAVLRSAWSRAAERAGVNVRTVSTEYLSRGDIADRPGLLVVDEAHHFRNPATRRYARLARLAARVPVLLISATPVHNRRADLTALLALFLGSAVHGASDSDLTDCIVRREHRDVPAIRLPRLSRTTRIEIAADTDVLDRILSLPPPVALRDGGVPAALIPLGLAHAWSSSDAALLGAIRRRITRGEALRDALTAGRVPSRTELGSWNADEFGAQLGFAELLVDAVAVPTTDAAAQLDRHLAALRALLLDCSNRPSRDAKRLALLRELIGKHRHERLVAFSAHADTVHAFYHELRAAGAVAVVTGGGGRIASGRIPADEVLRTFRQPAHERERIHLLLATDLLSEGVDLPEASVVIHLDLPWTAARIEQRVGRLRRLDSAARAVRSYTLAQPPAVERRLGKELLLLSKARLAAGSIGGLDGVRDTAARQNAVRCSEALRQQAHAWASPADPAAARPGDAISVAAVASAAPGFLALIRTGDGVELIGGLGPPERRASTRDPRRLLRLMRNAGGEPAAVTARQYCAARRAIASALQSASLARALGPRAMPPVVQRLIERLNLIVAQAPSHVRPAAAARASRVLAALARRLPIGIEFELQRVAMTVGDEELPAAIESILLPDATPPTATESRVTAVLLLSGLPSQSDPPVAANDSSRGR